VPEAIHFQSTCMNRVDFRRLHQTCKQKCRRGLLPIETLCHGTGYVCAHYEFLVVCWATRSAQRTVNKSPYIGP
jgi:hypothetical protein